MSNIFESRQQLVDWATGPGLRIVLIFLAAVIASYLARRLIRVAVRPRILAPGFEGSRDIEALHAREATVESFLIRSANTFIIFGAGMVILSELGINVTPLLASAGIVGVAIGLGAQTLVRDAIAGIFLLIEDHYDLGDRVRLNGIEGNVIEVSLRRTTIRGDDGAVHTIPNGAITVTTNLSEANLGEAVGDAS
jgi:small-conductance mechanosensitive channel